MPSSGILSRVDLLRTDVSEESSASLNTGTRIGALGTASAVTIISSQCESVASYG
jgi:hypothetical protein